MSLWRVIDKYACREGDVEKIEQKYGNENLFE